MISQGELKATYDKQGYVVCDNLLSEEIVAELKTVTNHLVTAAGANKGSNETYEFIEETKGGPPRLERINSPHKVDPLFDQLIRKDEIINVLRLLLEGVLKLPD